MQTPIKIILAIIIGFLFCEPCFAQLPNSKIGSFNQFTDVGSFKLAGAASYHEPSQTYLVKGSGSNIWARQDSFSFLSKKMSGDFIMQTKLRFIGTGNELHRKTGLMIRSSNASNAATVVC